SDGGFWSDSRPSTPACRASRAISKRSFLSRLPGENIMWFVFRFDQQHAAPAPFLKAEIDLTPEHLEIVDRRSHRAEHDQPEQHQTHVLQRRMIRREDDGAAGHYLQNHFRLAQSIRGNHQAFHGRDFAQPHHHTFAPHDDDNHPRLHQMHLDQWNERGDNQQLIRNRIQQNSQRCDFAPFARNVSIGRIRGRRDQQNQNAPNFEMKRKSPEIPIRLASQQDDNQERNKEDSQNRQTVRQVHFSLGQDSTEPATGYQRHLNIDSTLDRVNRTGFSVKRKR